MATATRRPIRVLWLAKGLGPGGMERLLVHHARFGDRDRFEYAAAHVVDRPNSVIPELLELGVPCERLGNGRGSDPRWVLALLTLVRRGGFDVVHAHSPLPAAIIRPLARLQRRRPRLVYTEHNTWDCYGRATRSANMITYPLDDAQFAVSADAAASPPPRLARHVEVLTHGIDLEAVKAVAARRGEVRAGLGIDDTTVVVTTVANLRREKGYDVLLDTAQRVLDRHDHVLFLALGHGPLEAELHRRHEALGLGDRFRFLGFRSDALDVLAASDVFTLGSRQEGLPVAYMEATALGVPAVVTAVGGLRHAVNEVTGGVLVEPERADLLADALDRVLVDPRLRRRLAGRAEASSSRFDAREAIRRQEQVYEELVG